MTLFSQTWSGIKQEFAIYKRRPRYFFQENASVILTSLIIVPNHLANYIQKRQDPPISIVIWMSIVFYSPIFTILNKLVREKETKFTQYLIVNGMLKSSYMAKTALKSYILIFFIAMEKTIEFIVFQEKLDFTMMIRLFALYFISGIAAINMALVLSTCLKASLAGIASFLLFVVIPLFIATTTETQVEPE